MFVELRHVSKSYAGQQAVLHDANLEVAQGELIVILGRSGSGKSTLLKLIGGLDTPDAGEVVHAGRNLSAMKDVERTKFRRQSLGFVFQFFNLIPTLTVSENIRLPLALNRCADTAAERRIAELLDALGLAGRAASFPEELSGGEQQRVAIARALAHDPKLILADEPTGNLDVETADEVLRLLTTACRNSSTTLIVATHSDEVARIADRVLRIRHGALEAVT